MNRRQFLRWLPLTGAAATIRGRFGGASASVIVDRQGWWGVPGAVWQLVTHEFGQTWMRVR